MVSQGDNELGEGELWFCVLMIDSEEGQSSALFVFGE